MALLEQDKNNRTRGEDDDDDASKEDDKDVYRVGLVGRGRKRARRKSRVTLRRERMATQRDHSRRRSPTGPYTGIPLALIKSGLEPSGYQDFRILTVGINCTHPNPDMHSIVSEL